MKANKKALALVLCALMLVAASVFGTLAYLTDTATVTNTFTVGDVKITLDETDVDLYGKQDGDTRVTANNYKLIPGHNYKKDPIVHIDPTSEDCYVFVQITNAIAEIEDTGDTIAAQMKAKGWHLVNGQTNVYFYGASDDATDAAVVNAVTTPNLTVFEEFTIDGDIDNDDLSKYADKTIEIIAYAIQADGINAEDGKTVAEKAWTALFDQMQNS